MLRIEERYAALPQTIVKGFTPTGLAWHWTAGGTGRAGWEATVRYLIDTRYTKNASYHAGFWHEHDTETTVVQWVVRTTNAAHSLNPALAFVYHATKDRATQDARFAEVRRILGTKATDPNAGCIAVSYAGMPADLERDLACPVFRADLQELARQLIAHPAVIDQPHFGHGWIQPATRFEMDVATDFIGLLYGDDMASLKGADPIVNRRAIIGAGATVRSEPAFDRNDYDRFKLFGVGDSGSNAPMIAWVQGTNLTLNNGTVYDARTRWAAIQSKGIGIGFVHERDVVRLEPIEEVVKEVIKEVPTGITQAQLDEARKAGQVDMKTRLTVKVQGEPIL